MMVARIHSTWCHRCSIECMYPFGGPRLKLGPVKCSVREVLAASIYTPWKVHATPGFQ